MDLSETTTGAGRYARSREARELGSGRLRLVGRRGGGSRGFLARIGRLGLRRQRLAVGVEELDLGRAVQLRDRVALRLLGDVTRRLILDLLERREALGPDALDLDDVPAELGLDRRGNLAFLQLEGGLREFRHHAVLGEPAEGAAFASSSVGSRMWRAWISCCGGSALAASS